MKNYKQVFLPFSIVLTLIIIFQLWTISIKGDIQVLDYVIRLPAFLILYGMYSGLLKFDRWVELKVNQHPLLMTITDQYIEGTVLSHPALKHKVMIGKDWGVEKAIIEIVLAHHKATPRFNPSQYVSFRIESYNDSLEEVVKSALRKVGVIGFTHAVNAKNDVDLLIHAQNNPYNPTEE